MKVINRKPSYTLFIFCLSSLQVLLAGGLRFFGNDYPIDKRTSYHVFSGYPVTFSKKCEIGFGLSLYLTSEIGNIIRIKADDSRVFNLFYDGHGDSHLFLLNEEGKSNLVSAALNKSEYP